MHKNKRRRQSHASPLQGLGTHPPPLVHRGVNLGDTLKRNLQSLELGDLYFHAQVPGLWFFIMASIANEHTSPTMLHVLDKRDRMETGRKKSGWSSVSHWPFEGGSFGSGVGITDDMSRLGSVYFDDVKMSISPNMNLKVGSVPFLTKELLLEHYSLHSVNRDAQGLCGGGNLQWLNPATGCPHPCFSHRTSCWREPESPTSSYCEFLQVGVARPLSIHFC